MKKSAEIICITLLVMLTAFAIYMDYKRLSDTVKIKINPQTPLSGVTKDYVYNSRKEYVKESIFYKDGYEPSEDVFGQIVDYKPWISVVRCQAENAPSRTDGPSEEAREINNPSLLITIDFPQGYIEPQDPYFCNFPMIPDYAEYKKSSKELTLIYPPLFTGDDLYQFKGINARDFGYPFAYLDKSKSENIVEFVNNVNVSNKVSEFQDFIHLGGSCDVEGGCNNGSPWQDEILFRYKNDDKPVKLYFKLWKEMPSSTDSPADINEIIIISPKKTSLKWYLRKNNQ